ncbi:ankyrin repeat domain-containing protein [Flavobacterium sp. F-65]|jgi:ankyrin repeat protein|uniref:Ankyrin repeat domain-containing protein n=1 Tax=Flavobacterium pisciphilum TaxID=2893755 RepID=A0ABS8MNW6_9FLAO|nr:ankyrin repeat domain-containing protein [Flavobacterium sp. F-65]MCC9070464.1 ankyrin repeat domain-containing protein [Flavobacterium sp. F-65]
MKNSIVYLGVALVAFVNVSLASNSVQKSFINDKAIVSSFDSAPLNTAIRKGDIETVKKFIEYGVDVNKISNELTPLMTAARYNQVEIIKILLSNGANIKAKNEKGFTALKYAELSNAKDAVALLKRD